MQKKRKKIFDEYRKLKDERVFELVNDAFKNSRGDSRKAFETLEKLGFQWVDDGDELELEEEQSAVCENTDQEFLAAFFDGHVNLSDALVTSFLTEKNADSPNYPLFRRYFRQGNPRLKKLLLFALAKAPADQALLHDLAFFHEFKPMLGELIALYTRACEYEADLTAFAALAEDFYYNTFPDGYNALHALRELFQGQSQKLAVVENLIDMQKDIDSAPDEVIKF